MVGARQTNQISDGARLSADSRRRGLAVGESTRAGDGGSARIARNFRRGRNDRLAPEERDPNGLSRISAGTAPFAQLFDHHAPRSTAARGPTFFASSPKRPRRL